MLASRDGKIVFENTLDARLDVVFRKKLPEVFRFKLWIFILVLHKFICFFIGSQLFLLWIITNDDYFLHLSYYTWSLKWEHLIRDFLQYLYSSFFDLQ